MTNNNACTMEPLVLLHNFTNTFTWVLGASFAEICSSVVNCRRSDIFQL